MLLMMVMVMTMMMINDVDDDVVNDDDDDDDDDNNEDGGCFGTNEPKISLILHFITIHVCNRPILTNTQCIMPIGTDKMNMYIPEFPGHRQ